jgi:hypothetical protein
MSKIIDIVVVVIRAGVKLEDGDGWKLHIIH